MPANSTNQLSMAGFAIEFLFEKAKLPDPSAANTTIGLPELP
jgi:hypothetical protein